MPKKIAPTKNHRTTGWVFKIHGPGDIAECTAIPGRVTSEISFRPSCGAVPIVARRREPARFVAHRFASVTSAARPR